MKGGIFNVFLQACTEKTLFIRKNTQKIWLGMFFKSPYLGTLYLKNSQIHLS